MRIGELAGMAGVTTKAIRYYEGIGVMPEPERASNSYRDYGPEAVERLRFIRDAQDTGLTLNEIASILELREQGAASCRHVVELLDRHLLDLDAHIENLRKTREHLVGITNRARTLDPADCTDPNRCQTIESGSRLGGRSGEHIHASPSSHPHH
jgi:DNA-binding transcriptional MerR regulator